MFLLSYAGWKNCLRLANKEIELIVTLDVGPRIIRFGLIGGENEFAEYPEQRTLANDGVYHSYGGHRLWAAPEVRGWTNHPDNSTLEWREENDEFIFTAPKEEGTGLQKTIRISLDTNRNYVRINHIITNHSITNLILAPWAISVMAPGGRAIVPQEQFLPHDKNVRPVRPLVLWGYTDMQDPRWTWGSRFIQLRQDSQAKTVQKFGAQVTQGWAAYINSDRVFFKHFSFDSQATYPDFGCNAEFYTNQRMLEFESLGPLSTPKPGEFVTHEENWYLFKNIQVGQSEEEIEATLSPLLKMILTS